MNQKKWDWFFIVLGTLGLKVFLFWWGAIHFDFKRYPFESWHSIWHRWDTRHFERLAQYSYSPLGLSQLDHEFLSHVPPGFPTLIWMLTKVGIPLYFAGFLIPILSFVIASLILYELALHEYKDRKVALRAVTYLAIFPTSYFSQMPYSEATFLMWSVLCFYFLRVKENLFLACLFAFLATTTRWIGVTLFPVLALQGLIWLRQKRLSFFNLVADLLYPALAVGVFFFINKHFYGSYFAFRDHAVKNTSIVRVDSFPYSNFVSELGTILSSPGTQFQNQQYMFTLGWGTLFLGVVSLLFLLLVRRLPWQLAVYGMSYLLFVSCLSWSISTNRLLFLVFPFELGFATIRNRFIQILYVLCSLGFLLYFTQIFVQGAWAF